MISFETPSVSFLAHQVSVSVPRGSVRKVARPCASVGRAETKAEIKSIKSCSVLSRHEVMRGNVRLLNIA